MEIRKCQVKKTRSSSERISFGSYAQKAISWMFKRSKISWESIFQNSVRVLLKRYGMVKGILVVDDKDLNRSKNARKLFRLHKIKDKKTGGYILGQNGVFLYFISKKISIPVGFLFYAPDPDLKKWAENDRDLKKKGIPKSKRPLKPQRSVDYPKKYTLALQLLRDFKTNFPDVNITAVLADCLYGHLPFISEVEKIWEKVQTITKMRKNQNIKYAKKIHTCENHFRVYPGWKQEIYIRGRKKQRIIAGGGRLYVPSHKAKRFVVGLKYEGEKEYRYIMGSNLKWNMKEMMEIFSLRWLIEVFFEDWSCYQGFCSLAKQCGKEGSERPLILSLLFDHCFLFHKEQQLRIRNRSPLATFGSLLEKTRAEVFCRFVEKIIQEDSPKLKLLELVNQIDEVFVLRPSKKHLTGVEIEIKYLETAA